MNMHIYIYILYIYINRYIDDYCPIEKKAGDVNYQTMMKYLLVPTFRLALVDQRGNKAGGAKSFHELKNKVPGQSNQRSGEIP